MLPAYKFELKIFRLCNFITQILINDIYANYFLTKLYGQQNLGIRNLTTLLYQKILPLSYTLDLFGLSESKKSSPICTCHKDFHTFYPMC